MHMHIVFMHRIIGCIALIVEQTARNAAVLSRRLRLGTGGLRRESSPA